MRRRPLLISVGIVFTAATIFVWRYYANTARYAETSHRQLVHEEQLAEREGIPLSRSSLMDVKPPAAQDAGPIYEQLRTIWKGRANDEDNIILSNVCQSHSPTPAEMSSARLALKRQAHALTLIHQAASRPHCVLQIHWEMQNPADIQYPQLAIVRRSTRFLEAESIVMASDGRYSDAVRNAALGFKVAGQGANGKSAIAYLLGVACDAITLGAMRKILYLYGDKPGVAALVHDEVTQNFKPPSPAASLRSEAAINIALLEYVRANGWPSLYALTEETPRFRDKVLEATILRGKLWDGMRNTDGVYIVQHMRKAIPIADRPYFQIRSALVALDNDVATTTKPVIVAQLVLPTLEKLLGKRAQVQNDAQMVMLASQIIDQHIPGSAYPLSVHTATDMYTGKPLRYRREGSGFIIYTPGLEGAFDGGSPTTRPKFAEYVFHYPMPPYYLHPEPKDP
jgi:hypothetical protein